MSIGFVGAFRYNEEIRHKAAVTLQNGARAWRYRARHGHSAYSAARASAVPWVPWAVQIQIIKIQSSFRNGGESRTLSCPAFRRTAGRATASLKCPT